MPLMFICLFLQFAFSSQPSVANPGIADNPAVFFHAEREFGIMVSDRVKAGQPIARTGKTGWIDRDHLHFLTFMSDGGRGKFGVISLRPRFK